VPIDIPLDSTAGPAAMALGACVYFGVQFALFARS